MNKLLGTILGLFLVMPAFGQGFGGWGGFTFNPVSAQNTWTEPQIFIDSVTAGNFIGDGSGLTNISATDATRVLKSGDTMTGDLTIETDLAVDRDLVVGGTSTLIGDVTALGNIVSAGLMAAASFDGSTMTLTGNAFSVGGSTFVVSGGNVGIANATPMFPFQVRTDDILVSATGRVGMNMGSEGGFPLEASLTIGPDSGSMVPEFEFHDLVTIAGDNSGEMKFQSRNASSVKYLAAQISVEVENNINGTEAADITWDTSSGGSVTEKMRLDSSGKLGIGTTDPSFSLDIQGDIRSTGAVIADKFFGDGSGLTGIAGGGPVIASTETSNVINIANTFFLKVATLVVTLDGGETIVGKAGMSIQNSSGGGKQYEFKVTRDGTDVSLPFTHDVGNGSDSKVSIEFFESSSTSGSVTYNIEIKSDSSGGTQNVMEKILTVMEF